MLPYLRLSGSNLTQCGQQCELDFDKTIDLKVGERRTSLAANDSAVADCKDAMLHGLNTSFIMRGAMRLAFYQRYHSWKMPRNRSMLMGMGMGIIFEVYQFYI